MAIKPQKQLKKIIKRMRKIQKAIAADAQPASPLQLEELVQLGSQYGVIVEKLKERDSDAIT